MKDPMNERPMPPQGMPQGTSPRGASEQKPEGGIPGGMMPGRPGGGGHGGMMSARLNAQKPKQLKKTVGRLFSYIGGNRKILILMLTVTLAIIAVDLAGPFLQQKAIDTISLDAVTGKLTVDYAAMVGYLCTMLGIFGVSALLSYVSQRLSLRLSQNTVYALRNDLFTKISHLPIFYTDRHRHGDIMSRMTNDCEQVSNAVSQSVNTLFSGVITILGALCMMLYYSPLMTLIAILTIPLTVFISGTLAKFMKKYFAKQQMLLGQMNGQVEEMVTGYRTVVAYGKEKEAVRTFAGISDEFRKNSIKARVWGSVMGPVMNFVGNLQYVILAAVGGTLMIFAATGNAPENGVGAVLLFGAEGMTIGAIQAMLQYSKKFTRPINMIANQYSTLLTALAAAERVFEIMDTPDEIDEGKIDLNPAAVKGEIDFSDIHFSYIPGEPVLKGLNLHVGAGQKIAIVGATGSGKTTIVNLLTRFYEIDGGKITVDGVDIRDIPKERLRRMIGIVLQDTVLFSDTIRANIKYGRDGATDEEMKEAAHHAKADAFIDHLPEGYDTVLSESGANLSAGQRQLLAIARAILADPDILILDEATSSVDTRTEMHIQQAMVALIKNRTSLIIAHRLSTIRDADCIVVVNDGVICEAGNHEELLATGGRYYQLYRSQFAGQET